MIWVLIFLFLVIGFRELAVDALQPQNNLGQLACWGLGVAGTFLSWFLLALLADDGPEVK